MPDTKKTLRYIEFKCISSNRRKTRVVSTVAQVVSSVMAEHSRECLAFHSPHFTKTKFHFLPSF